MGLSWCLSIMPFYLSFWLLFLQWPLCAICQITLKNNNESLHSNAAFVWKNKHTATEYNSGSGYRRVFKAIINFRPVQQSYKCLSTFLSRFCRRFRLHTIFSYHPRWRNYSFPEALSFCYWKCLWKLNSHHFEDHISTSVETVPVSKILWCYMGKEDKCERIEGNKRVPVSNHQKKRAGRTWTQDL